MAPDLPNYEKIREVFEDEMPKVANTFADAQGVVGAINQLKDELKSEFSARMTGLTDDLNGKIDGVKGDIATIKADITTMKADITTTKADITTMKADITTIKADIATMDGKITTIERDVEDLKISIDEAIHGIEEVEEGMKIADYNSIARAQNALVVGPNRRFTRLRNPATGGEIPDLPQTPREIDRLGEDAADTILQNLGQSTDGGVMAKRTRIRLAVGLPS